MLELTSDLPAGARTDGALDLLAQRMDCAQAHWYHGAAGDMARDAKTGAIMTWAPRAGSVTARPTEPNAGNSLLSEAGELSGLQCRPGKHCGQVAEAITDDASHWTIAVIYLPPVGDDARTLLTLNTAARAGSEGGGNYLFVSEVDGTLTVKDDAGGISISTMLTPTEAPRLITVSLTGDTLALQVDGGLVLTTQGRAGMSGPGDLFIGCRSHRPRLHKTLGGALIMDVLFWPGLSLLTPRTEAERDQAMALTSHMLWAF